MKKLSFIIAFCLSLAGCHWTEGKQHRTKVPAYSVLGTYKAQYDIYIDMTKVFSGTTGSLTLSADYYTNTMSSFQFKSYNYDSSSNPNKPTARPGIPERVSISTGQLPVDGVPYDVSFKGEFKDQVILYGETPETVYSGKKTYRSVNIILTGWMKERGYRGEPSIYDFDCEIILEFTIEGKNYKIIITDAEAL